MACLLTKNGLPTDERWPGIENRWSTEDRWAIYRAEMAYYRGHMAYYRQQMACLPAADDHPTEDRWPIILVTTDGLLPTTHSLPRKDGLPTDNRWVIYRGHMTCREEMAYRREYMAYRPRTDGLATTDGLPRKDGAVCAACAWSM